MSDTIKVLKTDFIALDKRIDFLEYALEESVKLQSHYAQILNEYDEGRRLIFKSREEWEARLRSLHDESSKRS